jgi:hypothetical protein
VKVARTFSMTTFFAESLPLAAAEVTETTA